MGTNANCMFKVTGWNEEPYEEFEGGAKLTRAKVSQSYQGDISGEGFVEYLMSYTANGTANFVGMELVKGNVAGKSGSFVIQHVGVYEGGKARSTWSVIPGTGTGDLAALRANGSYVVGHGEAAQVSFGYLFEES